MIELKNKYISDYWFNDNIIDCSKYIDDESNEIQVIIPNSDINIITQKHIEYINENPNNKCNKEKLNYNNEINNTEIYNEYQTNKNKSNSRINTTDISTRNTKCNNRFKSDESIISNNRVFIMEKSNQYNKLLNQSYTNNNQRKMYSLFKTSYFYEFKPGKRKVLLDS
jgi:hypothetical protein